MLFHFENSCKKIFSSLRPSPAWFRHGLRGGLFRCLRFGARSLSFDNSTSLDLHYLGTLDAIFAGSVFSMLAFVGISRP